MRFRFQLEGVLRVRLLLENQARERLDEAMSQLRALEHSLAEAIEWSQKTARITHPQSLPAAEVQFVESVLLQTQQAIAGCRRRKRRRSSLPTNSVPPILTRGANVKP